jgi:hypothetical protein
VSRAGRPRWWLVLCLAVCVEAASAALPIQIDADGLTSGQLQATQQLLDEAQHLLPPAWTQALDSRITLAWEQLPARVQGHAALRRLSLSRALLDQWMAQPAVREADAMSPAHRAALTALIHELAHFYDRTGPRLLSRDPRLLDLAGWQVAPLRLGLRRGRNDFRDRSPDSYELTNSKEFVAVNLEYFVLDPDYACRRPALHRFFSAHFQWTPPEHACAPRLPYLQAEQDEPAILELDPARVYEVDYLLAEGNRQPMSRWGHSMLRLVICAPERKPGPDCRLDLRYHRVLSFRAFVDDVQISNWRGLTGSYPSRLFLLPLNQVIDEYTKVELRGLRSVPLRLSPDEIADLLSRAAQLHWSYDGHYYFLGNNCAVETFKLLHDGVPRLADERLGSITPNALLRRLRRAGVADVSVLQNEAEALRLGYRFAAADAQYQSMYDIASQALGLPHRRVSAWLDMPPDSRAPWLEQADLRTGAALLLLEEAALRRQELAAYDELKRRLLGAKRAAADDAPDRQFIRELLESSNFLSRPATLLSAGGYGLPSTEELQSVAAQADQRVTRLLHEGAALRLQARQWLPARQREALEQTQANIAALIERMRTLNREQGGLLLQ